MPLEELDVMRKQITDLGSSLTKEKEAHQKTKEEVISVRADKRTVRITKKVSPPLLNPTKVAERIAYTLICDGPINSNVSNVIDNRVLLLADKILYNLKNFFPEYFSQFDYLIDIKDYQTITQGKTEETIEYINFDDVQQDLRRKIEVDVITELTILREGKAKYEIEKQKLEKTFRDLLITKENEISDIRLKWKNEIEKIKSEKDTISNEEKLQSEINRLQKELKTKTFMSKLWLGLALLFVVSMIIYILK